MRVKKIFLQESIINRLILSFFFTTMSCMAVFVHGQEFSCHGGVIPYNHQCQSNKSMDNTIAITVGSSKFTLVLADTAAASAFKALLPQTVRMSDVNRNEKYYRMLKSLPSEAANSGTIHAGDLMLWGSDGLVLFYKDFSTTYSYTRLGRIDDVTGLAKALGSGEVIVTFEVPQGLMK